MNGVVHMAYSVNSKNKRGFTLVELIVTITILGILMAVAIPSIMGYFKKMDMIKANESARQIYTAAQNKLTAMKANGQLDLDEMTSEWALARVPDGSAAAADQTEQIKYYYMNTEKAAAFLSQAGQSLDDELVSTQASIVIELDPVNGYVYGVFFASYSDGDRTLFSYEQRQEGTAGRHERILRFRRLEKPGQGQNRILRGELPQRWSMRQV